MVSQQIIPSQKDSQLLSQSPLTILILSSQIQSMHSQFFQGLTFWLKGWSKLLTTRRLFFVAITPVLISITGFVYALFIVWNNSNLVALQAMRWMPWFPAFLGDWIKWPLLILVGILFSLAVTYLAYLLHMIIALPFYSVLAERTLRMRGIQLPQGGFNFTLRVLRASFLKSLLFIILGIGVFILSFIPALNLLAIAGAMMILSADIFDYTFEAKGFSLRERLLYLSQNFPLWLGMATALSVTLLMPGLALIITPGAVVGAAMNMKSAEN